MITAVTLNAAVDKSYFVERLERGKPNRVIEAIAVPGGKGINVARVAHALGAEVAASGFIGGTNGEFIHQGVAEAGLRSEFVRVAGNSRETIAVFDASRAGMTEFLEPGPSIAPQDTAILEGKLEQLAAASSVVAYSGSMPQGLPPDIYAKLIGIARSQGAITVLDTSGEALAQGIQGRPDICKPNRDELAQLLGNGAGSYSSIAAAAMQLVARGIRLVIVSMDKEGSIAATGHGVWHITPPSIQPVNTVGCGDSLVAGIAAYIDRQANPAIVLQPEGAQELIEALRLGTAAAASNALQRSAGKIDTAQVEQLIHQVQVTEITNG